MFRSPSTFFTRFRLIAIAASVIVLLLGLGVARATFAPSGETTTSTEGDLGITPPSGGGGAVNNEVVVVNQTDGRFANRSGFGIARVTGDTAENQNAAAATSSCADCRTVAVAVQIVLVQRTDASNISPKNLAIALNVGCTRCETFAAAYQYVVTTDGLARFSAGAQEELAALHEQVRALAATDDVPFPELEGQIDALVEQMWAVVDNELAQIGVEGSGRALKDVDEATEDDTPTPSPTGATPDPDSSPRDEDASDALGDQGTSDTSPSPSETPEPSPTPSTSS